MPDDVQRRKRSSRIQRWFWIGAMVLAAGWVVPQVVRVNFWRQEVAAALSRAVHRPVHVGDIHLRVVGGLGFDISNVAMEEDPAFGTEPFARAETVRAGVAVASLWRGRLEFSSLHLLSPSFNVVRNAQGRWNLESLGQTLSAPHPQDARLSPGPLEGSTKTSVAELRSSPRLRVTSGRINFKSGDRKESYRLDLLSLDLVPPASARRPWRFQLTAMPTRTDLPFRPTSPFEASGEFGPVPAGMLPETGIPLHLDWRTDGAALAELLTILTGRDHGIHGTFSLRGHASGTTSLFRLTAQGELADVHRWDLLPPGPGSLRAEFSSIVDLSADAVELTALRIPLGEGAVVVRGRVEDMFGQPQPRLEAELQQVPLAALVELLPRFDPRIPMGLLADGLLHGHLRSQRGLRDLWGTVEVSPGSLQVAENLPRLRFSAFPVVLEGDKGHLGPVRAEPGFGEPLQVALRWDAAEESVLWRLRGNRISLPALARLASGLGWGSKLSELPRGDLAVQLEIASKAGAPARLSGWAELTDAVVQVRTAAWPLRIKTARLQFLRKQLKIHPFVGEFGETAFQADLAVPYSPAHPDSGTGEPAARVEFALEASEINAKALAGMFAAAAPQESFFRFGRDQTPEKTPLDEKLSAFFNSMQASGKLSATAVSVGGITLEDFEAAVRFHERRLEIPEFSARHAGGTQRGRGVIRFAPELFQFTLESRYANLDLAQLTRFSEPWRGAISGTLRGTLHLSSSGGSLAEMLSQLTGSGELHASEVVLRRPEWTPILGLDSEDADAEAYLPSVSARFQVGDGRVQLPEAMALLARHAERSRKGAFRQETWRISGEVGFDQRVDLLLEGDTEGRQSHLAGMLSSPIVSRGAEVPSAAARSGTSPSSP